MSLDYAGSSSEFSRIGKGLVIKTPRQVQAETRLFNKINHSFAVELEILKILQTHPRIVKSVCHGRNEGEGDPRAIVLTEANKGNLQQYLDNHSSDEISLELRQSWCLQVVEAIAYIHSHGVVHSDLRPENFLVHETSPGRLDLWLCDFGGSTCERLNLDGGQLPDSGFFDPRSDWISTWKTDSFSAASILYSILTGHWPYRQPGPFTSLQEMEDYESQVDALFEQRLFPDVDGLFAGTIIMKCWNHEYSSMEEVLVEMRAIS
ncbi:hypothetical protein CP533_2164 [Ophiocordyceps camponoti-saundersi (nom. inval.)]|nr:hypothetical protein CP533_2164 [Ophiocordyceps camponoti-saundersi (nom. inval.)]